MWARNKTRVQKISKGFFKKKISKAKEKSLTWVWDESGAGFRPEAAGSWTSCPTMGLRPLCLGLRSGPAGPQARPARARQRALQTLERLSRRRRLDSKIFKKCVTRKTHGNRQSSIWKIKEQELESQIPKNTRRLGHIFPRTSPYKL